MFDDIVVSTEMAECQICTEKFNKSSRKQISCLFCNKACCKECIIGNITSNWDSNPEHCLFCKESWDLSFWYENFIKKEIDMYFKGLMFKKAIDTEHSKLYEYQEIAKLYKFVETNKTKVKNNNEEIAAIKARLTELQQENKFLLSENQNALDIIDSGAGSSSAKEYSIVCPKENCMFMLNKDFYCENCKVSYCKDCLEAVEDVDTHVCNKETVETMKLIKKNSKPCPGCGTSISKVDGCDQMWCIICKKGFSWKTGKIETGRIHNPEYFRWIREHGEIEENLNQVPVRHNNCVLPDSNYFYMILREWLEITNNGNSVFSADEKQAFLTYFLNIMRFGGHLDYKIDSNERHIEIRNNLNRTQSAKYLGGLISEDEWKAVIRYTASVTINNRDYNNIYQLVKIVILENVWLIVDEINKSTFTRDLMLDIKSKLDKIKDYANEAFTKLSSQKMHGGVRVVIKDDWIM